MSESVPAKPAMNIPVRVTTSHAPQPTQPPVTLPTLAANRPPTAPAKPKVFMKKMAVVKKTLSEEQRRKIMWVAVSASTVVIVVGWAVFGRAGWPTTGNTSLFADIKKAFSNFSKPDQSSASQTSQEIRDLTNQVFPQFETNQ